MELQPPAQPALALLVPLPVSREQCWASLRLTGCKMEDQREKSADPAIGQPTFRQESGPADISTSAHPTHKTDTSGPRSSASCPVELEATVVEGTKRGGGL